MKIPPIGYVAIACISLFLVSKVISTPQTGSICEAARNLDRVSCGDKIILAPPGGLSRRDKQAGFAAIKQQDYAQGVDLLQKDWELTKDPETLIVFNNAKLAKTLPEQIKTIAVVVPSTQTPIFVATSILKGVSEAQQEWNQTEHGWKLRVVIADDSNDPTEGKKIANELVKYPEILAVLGHYSSNVTVNVKDIYQQSKTVLLSATSTSDELTNNDSQNYFFRVVSSTKVIAKAMVDHWATKHDKIALFYTPNKKFSESLRKVFLAQIPRDRIVKEFDLTSPNNAAQEIAAAKAAGAKAIAIFPDGYTDAIERDRVLSIIKANQGQLPILGASIVRDTYLTGIDPNWLKNLVISIPIHASDRQYIDVGKLNQAPNWWGDKSQLHDRIIDSYDAAQVLLLALDKASDRITVQKVISSPNFNPRGITGKISFNGSDRAESINSLVTPNCTASKCEGFKPAFER
jgi:ABC-type branched-subunit amino acid transport system substrate-binding protein